MTVVVCEVAASCPLELTTGTKVDASLLAPPTRPFSPSHYSLFLQTEKVKKGQLLNYFARFSHSQIIFSSPSLEFSDKFLV